MAPVYPYLILCATLSLSRFLGPSAKDDAYYAEAAKFSRLLESHKKKYVKSVGHSIAKKTEKKSFSFCSAQDSSESIYTSSISAIQKSIQSGSSSKIRRWRTMVLLFLFLSGLISLSRGFALYHFYSGPQRMLYDAYPVLSSRTQNKWKSLKETAVFPDEILQHSEASKSIGRRITSFSMDVVPSAAMQFRLCIGREWYRFPSSFFLDFNVPSPFPLKHSDLPPSTELPPSFPSLYDYYSTEVPSTPLSTYGFLRTNFSGALPLDFFRQSPHSTGVLNFSLASAPSSSFWKSLLPNGGTIPRACHCASSLVNDLNFPIGIQYVHNYSFSCDAIFDSVEMPPPPKSRFFSLYLREKEMWDVQLEKEVKESHFDEFSQPIPISSSRLSSSVSQSSYRLLNVARTPFWCRVLYFPFGVTESCAVWRRLMLQEKP